MVVAELVELELLFFFFFFLEFGLLSTAKLQDIVGELQARNGVHNYDM